MAVSAYKEAVRVSPGMAAAHQNLANVYVDMGNFQHAIIHYMKALEINPEFERARRGLEEAQNMSTAGEKISEPLRPAGRPQCARCQNRSTGRTADE